MVFQKYNNFVVFPMHIFAVCKRNKNPAPACQHQKNNGSRFDG